MVRVLDKSLESAEELRAQIARNFETSRKGSEAKKRVQNDRVARAEAEAAAIQRLSQLRPGEKLTPEEMALVEAVMLRATAKLTEDERLEAARKNLLAFVEVTMPHPQDPDNLTRSRYEPARHHKVLAAALEELEAGRWPRLIVTVPPRHGKQCAHDTPVLTTSGWTKHGALKPGDHVFGIDGFPVKVLAISEESDAEYEVEFTNGEVIQCHALHEWPIYERPRRINTVRETIWFASNTRFGARRKLWSGNKSGRGGRVLFQAIDASHIVGAEVPLPVHPYALGVWLGDGTRGKPCVTMTREDGEIVARRLADCGYEISCEWVHKDTGVVTYSLASGKPGVPSLFAAALKSAGVIDKKGIPNAYMTASVDQRLDLLAGLIDTDGHVEVSTGRVRIVTACPDLADDIYRLVATLGFRPYVTAAEPCLSSSGIQGRRVVYTVGFQPTMKVPCALFRKRSDVISVRRRIGIADVRKVPAKKGRCIQVEGGLYLVGRSLIPTHNSELVSRRLPAWFVGRDPYRSYIFGTYNDVLAGDLGREVRDIMQSERFKRIFPGCELAKGSQAAERLRTTYGGSMFFIGVGGSLTGRGGDLIVIDDPIKNREDADSKAFRDKLWLWFTDVVMTRLLSETAAVVIVMTRWHEDDLVGRLTDPRNPAYSAKEAEAWRILDLPALAIDDSDPLGRKKGEPLWPERYGKVFLENQRRLRPEGFNALYQGRPTPDDGEFFKRDWIVPYTTMEQLPSNMRLYAASDHALGTKKRNDKSALGCFGVDEKGDIWILPDLDFGRYEANQLVELMLMQMRRHNPIRWFAENELISKSIMPFLTQRMREEQTYIHMDPLTSVSDLMMRARSFQGRMSMRMVHFPVFAPWWDEAREQLMKFPQGANDDFVSFCSLIGRGLDRMTFAAPPPGVAKAEPKRGTIAWIKWASERDKAAKVFSKFNGY